MTTATMGRTLSTCNPRLKSSYPVDGALDTALPLTAITLHFNEPVVSSTLEGKVTLTPPGIALAYSGWNDDTNSAEYSLDFPLDFSTDYVITIAEGILDENGNFMAQTAISFTTVNDNLPPAKISDLAVSNITDNSMDLSWTNSGDDGTEGDILGYEVRYLADSACPLHAGNFSNGKKIAADAWNYPGST